MIVNLLRFWLLSVLLNGLLLAHALAADPPPDAGALTFFGWSDQHVQTDGDAEHLEAAIDAMNALPGTHYHKAKVDLYRGRNFVQLPSPAPGSPSEFTVVRISADRIVAIPYDYEQKTWSDDSRKVLNATIRGSR